MNNKVLHQSLIDIEQNLKQLDSARSQVQTVSEMSERLITHIKQLVISVSALHAEFSSEKKSVQSILTTSLSDFKNELDKGGSGVLKKANDLNDSFVGSISALQNEFIKEKSSIHNNITASLNEFKNELEKGSLEVVNKASDLNDNLVKSINRSQYEFENEVISTQNKLNALLTDFKKNLDIGISEVLNKSNDIYNKQELVIDGTLKKISEFEYRLIEVQKSIQDFDLEKELSVVRTDIREISNILEVKINDISIQMNQLLIQQKSDQSLFLLSNKKTRLLIIIGFLILIATTLFDKIWQF